MVDPASFDDFLGGCLGLDARFRMAAVVVDAMSPYVKKERGGLAAVGGGVESEFLALHVSTILGALGKLQGELGRLEILVARFQGIMLLFCSWGRFGLVISSDVMPMDEAAPKIRAYLEAHPPP